MTGGNTATLFNGVTFVPGVDGQAFSFDGVDDRAQLSDVEALKLTGSLSIECWMRALVDPAQPPGLSMILFRGDDRDALDPYFLAVGGYSLQFHIGASATDVVNLLAPLPTNRWAHIAATLDDATGLMRIYVDGVVAGETVTTVRPFRDLDPLSNPGIGIGNHGGYPKSPWQLPFRGQLDELAVYNRALSGEEVTEFFIAGPSGKCKVPVTVQLDSRVVQGSTASFTNSASLQLGSAFAGGTISYSLDGSDPGSGRLYAGPVVLTQSVTLRAIAYDADYAQSGTRGPVSIAAVFPPRFTLQPAGQGVPAGGSVVFQAAATGAPPLRWQWFFNNAALLNATNPALPLLNVQAVQAGPYRVVVTNSSGAVTSAPAALSVLTFPTIVTQSVGSSINLGQDVRFCVEASGSAPLTYQWRINGANLPAATNPCITLLKLQAGDAGSYTVAVANGAGVKVSQPIVLEILDFPNGPVPADFFSDRNELFGQSPRLEVDNFNATKEPGENNHAGKPGGASVWYKWTPDVSGIASFSTSGSALDTLLAVYTGSDVASLTPVVSDEDRGGFLTSAVRFNALAGVEYEIAIDGFAGNTGKLILEWNLETTAQVLPVLTKQPSNQTLPLGGSALLNVSASGSGLQYQWFLNGVRIPGATGATLLRTNVGVADVGSYVLAVTNGLGRGTLSDAALVEIGPFANLSSVDKVEDILPAAIGLRTVAAGSSVSVGSIGTQILNTTNATTSAAETNHCGVIGGSSRWLQLNAGGNGTMALDTFNSGFDTVLAVYVGDGTLGNYPTRLLACNDDAFPGTHWSRVVFPATNGAVFYVAIDGPGGVSGPVVLNWSLGSAPVAPTNPPAVDAPRLRQGDVLSLSTVLTNAVPPPHWQWYKDGTAIPNATNKSYLLGGVQAGNAGLYSVVASNGIGTVTGVVARVTVEVPLQLAAEPARDVWGVHLRLHALAGLGFLVQWTTNLANWLPLATNVVPSQPFLFEDYSNTNRARRFYRALPWP